MLIILGITVEISIGEINWVSTRVIQRRLQPKKARFSRSRSQSASEKGIGCFMRSAKKFCTDLWQMLMQRFRPTSSTNTVIPKCFVGSEKAHHFCLGAEHPVDFAENDCATCDLLINNNEEESE